MFTGSRAYDTIIKSEKSMNDTIQKSIGGYNVIIKSNATYEVSR